MTELTKVDGIGKGKADALIEEGINTAEELAEAEVNEIVKQEWIDAAIELVTTPEQELANVDLVLTSGALKNRRITWTEGHPVVTVHGIGAVLSLSEITIADRDDGKFNMIWNGQVSAGDVTEHYQFFKKAVNSVSPAKQNVVSNYIGTATTAAKNIVSTTRKSGCSSCGG